MFWHRLFRVRYWAHPTSALRVIVGLAILFLSGVAWNEVRVARAADAHWSQVTTSGPGTRGFAAIYELPMKVGHVCP